MSAEEAGFSWARLECELGHLDDEGLAEVTAPLAGDWCIEDCGDTRALTLASLAEPAAEPEPVGGGEAAEAGEPETGGVLRFTGARFANMVASCSLRPGGGAAGLVYRASPDGDYLGMELDPERGTVALVAVKAGRRRVLAEAAAELPRGAWLHLYLRHVNPFHSLSLNGALVLTTEYRVPGGYLATGAVGVKAARPRDAWFARIGAVDVVAGD